MCPVTQCVCAACEQYRSGQLCFHSVNKRIGSPAGLRQTIAPLWAETSYG